MIDVLYHRRFHRLAIKGHANSGEAGHDLVCAAASILAYTLAAAVINADAEMQVRDPIIRIDGGDTEISCKPVHKWDAVISVIFDSICAGFTLLERQYPENIKVAVVG